MDGIKADDYSHPTLIEVLRGMLDKLFTMWELLQWREVIFNQDRISESLTLIFPVLGTLFGGWFLML
jgi:hypothetical protein